MFFQHEIILKISVIIILNDLLLIYYNLKIIV